jgi:hypothetical protein
MANLDWHRLLNVMSVDNLCFEKQNRLSELEYLKDKSSRIHYQEGRCNDDWEQSFEEASERKTMGRNVNPSGYETENDLGTERSRMESRIIELEQEIEMIEKVLEPKLR